MQMMILKIKKSWDEREKIKIFSTNYVCMLNQIIALLSEFYNGKKNLFQKLL